MLTERLFLGNSKEVESRIEEEERAKSARSAGVGSSAVSGAGSTTSLKKKSSYTQKYAGRKKKA